MNKLLKSKCGHPDLPREKTRKYVNILAGSHDMKGFPKNIMKKKH